MLPALSLSLTLTLTLKLSVSVQLEIGTLLPIKSIANLPSECAKRRVLKGRLEEIYSSWLQPVKGF